MIPTFTEAARSAVIVPSSFSGYDFCLNPYVGCQFGCSYCYVKFFLKDKLPWGEFVRTRLHLEKRLPKDLKKIANHRLVLGTMTDPYQPAERRYRLTRKALSIILNSEDKPDKVGIFTRSPTVRDDLDIIKKLPRARIHFTVSPFDYDIVKKLEPIPVTMNMRFKTIEKIKAVGIRTHVNIAPAIPMLSEHLTETLVKRLVGLGVDEFFVDPMQAYSNSSQGVFDALSDNPNWGGIHDIMLDRFNYAAWKRKYKNMWFEAWSKYGNNNILAIMSDHESGMWINMNTGEIMSPKLYGDDLTEFQQIPF